MLEFVLSTIFWTLAIYGLFEVIKNIIYISRFTKFKSDGIYVIIAVKNQEEKIEGFLRSILFKILYGREDYFSSYAERSGGLMNFHVLTLFPDMIEAGLHTSVTGRALKNGYIHLSAVNIRDYSKDKHKHVDDYPYGGGAGMVMQPEPIYLAYEDVTQNMEKKPRVVYVTPQGSVFNQSMAEEFSKEEDLIFLCGHYEGVDERILEEIVTDLRARKGLLSGAPSAGRPRPELAIFSPVLPAKMRIRSPTVTT